MLHSISKKRGDHIVIPIELNKYDKKFLNDGFDVVDGVLLSDTTVDIRYEKERFCIDAVAVIGCDQGMKDTLTLSNGQFTPRVGPHGETAMALYKKIYRKRYGSKAYNNAKTELENFIRWQINQTVKSFNGTIKQINLEKIYDIKRNAKCKGVVRIWSNPFIVDALKSRCEISGVHVRDESSAYMSQRCSECGLVRKANRKGKMYKCSHCGLTIDADLNAAINHTRDLPAIDWRFRKLKKSAVNGFFWKPDGLYEVSDGGEPGVHLDPITGVPLRNDEYATQSEFPLNSSSGNELSRFCESFDGDKHL